MDNKRTVAIVPVKHTSERVQNKNFRQFDEENQKSLFDLLIDKLEIPQIDKIYVSTNSDHVKEDKSRYEIITRPDEFCNNVTPWSDVISNVLRSIPEPGETTVLWCHTTCPLFVSYTDALSEFNNRCGEYDSLVAVSRVKEFILNDSGLPINYNFGHGIDIHNIYQLVQCS